MITFNKKTILLLLPFLTLAITFFTAYHASISAMLSHGMTWHFLIPFMALVLVWKQTIFPVPGKNNIIGYVTGIFLVLFAFFIVFTGEVTSTQALTELGIVVGLWGTVLFTGGFRLIIALLWPLLYLFFISSLTEGAFDIFTDFFRNASAKLSFILARMVGFSIMNAGTYLRLPMMVLNVANECSGINHFISLAAIAIPLAVLTQRKIWTVIIIVISSFPIALFSNSLRVFFLIWYNYNRMEFSHGPKNILVTGVGFFIGLLLLYGLAMLLSLIFDDKNKKESRIGEVSFAQYAMGINKKPFYILSILFIISFAFLRLWTVIPTEQPKIFTQSIPSLQYHYQSVPTIPGIDTLPETSKYVALRLEDSLSTPWYLFIGWYAKQEQNREVAGYNWDKFFIRTGKHLYTSSMRNRIEFNTSKAHAEGGQYIYLITYCSRNHCTASPLKIRLYLLLDALLYRSTSGAICILALPASSDNSSGTYTNNFIDKCFPVIKSIMK